MENTASEVRPAGELDWLLLVPALALSALVIILCAAVSFRVPLQGADTPLGIALAVLAVTAGWRWHRSPSVRPLVGLAALAALAAWLATVDYAGKWLPSAADIIGLHPDSWSYQAFADYLDHYRRGQFDGMPMVDEFGSHLQGTRFAAPALLAFLHDQPVLSDVPMTRVIFSLMCLGVHFFSMLALGRALVGYTGWYLPLLAAFLATAGGWFGRTLMAANNDNLIFASLTPALIALGCAPRAPGDLRPVVRWRVVVALALIFGAMLYNYPEGTALLGVLCLPLVAALCWRAVAGRPRSWHWLEPIAGGLLGLGLASPYLPTLAAFLHLQMNSGLGTNRPGEGLLPGLLLGPSRLAGAFALGDEVMAVPAGLASSFLPLCLLALMIPGALFIARRQRWFPWVALPLAGLYLWQGVAKHYDYGTFKVLVTASWWTYPVIAAGLVWIAERGALATGGKIALAAALLLTVGIAKCVNRQRRPPVALAAQVKSLQELSSLRFVTGHSPVLLALDDDFDYLWATYYLRGLPLSTWRQKSYLAMPHITPVLVRGIFPPPETCRYRLVTGPRPDALWQNARFSLERTPPVYLADLQNPVNGLESVEGRRFLWIGTQPTTFQIAAAHAGHYALSAARFDFGPSMAGRGLVHIVVTDADGTRETEVTPRTSAIPITLAAGDNVVVLRCQDVPEPGPHNGDPRELMLGVLAPEAVTPSGKE